MDIRYLRPVGRPVKDKHSCYCKVMTVKGPWRRDGYMKPIECFLLSEEYAPSLPDQMSKPLRVLNLCDCSRNPDGCVRHVLASKADGMSFAKLVLDFGLLTHLPTRVAY